MTDARDLERKSSAVTLSDMEIFIFPELLYSLVLANIMSPRIWQWALDPWFDGFDRMKPYRRIIRLKQYIMDHYAFNLDLDTWGLTTKEREIARFKDFIEPETLKQSNALFGYEGDKYYFDMDIRTHFGLNKYAGNVIPYWKTETVEAMDAFRYKPNYAGGAGECVSLAALYAAALFVVAKVPLRDIYLMATPLHSQNFIDIDDGILTNNRRLVTKNMWFNGTELSAQARRALENEQVTVLTHETGYIHVVYDDATIDRNAYSHFAERLAAYLKTEIEEETLGNFVRHTRSIQKCFQIRWSLHGVDHYIGMDRALAYEESTSYTISANTRDKLMAEIDNEEFQPTPFSGRIIFNDMEALVKNRKLCMSAEADVNILMDQFACECVNARMAIEHLRKFCCTRARLPDATSKRFLPAREPLGVDVRMTREQIITRLGSIRSANSMADMAFHSYRDLNCIEAEPFIHAAIQRNPVSIEGAKKMDVAAIVKSLGDLPNDSIYDDSGRLAQPDEVWNYGRGDGVEKALLLANILRNRMPEEQIIIEIGMGKATCKVGIKDYSFASGKQLKSNVWQIPRI